MVHGEQKRDHKFHHPLRQDKKRERASEKKPAHEEKSSVQSGCILRYAYKESIKKEVEAHYQCSGLKKRLRYKERMVRPQILESQP